MMVSDEAELYIKEHPIEGMFFSEFHHKLGPKITYQYPIGCITKDSSLCKAVINYLIPKPDLQQKLITVNTCGKKVVGCPVCIDDDQYQRNQYMFNFGLILDNSHRSSPYIPLIKKLSAYMTELERESYFVSNEETKALIPGILEKMLLELNEVGSCATRVNQATTLHLKLFPPSRIPPHIRDFHVPLILHPHVIDTREWDLTSQQIIPYIDGLCHVQKIATLADVDLELTRVCMQDLAMFGFLHIISIFQYSNSYSTTEKLAELRENEELGKWCVAHVARTGRQTPTIHDVMTLYSGMRADVKVRDLCTRYQSHITRVNEQKLIQFGLLHKLIRRVHVYPVLSGSTTPHKIPNELRRMLTGEHDTDEICCKLGISTDELMSRIECDPSIVILRK